MQTITFNDFTQLVPQLVAQIETPFERRGRKIQFRVLRFYVYGSRARGQHTAESDWDFYCVVENPGYDFQYIPDRGGWLFGALATKRKPDINGCSLEMWNEPDSAKNSFTLAVKTDGVLIWDSERGLVVDHDQYRQLAMTSS